MFLGSMKVANCFIRYLYAVNVAFSITKQQFEFTIVCTVGYKSNFFEAGGFVSESMI